MSNTFFLFQFIAATISKHRFVLAIPFVASARGAMDSASDFESGGCGFESRRACFFFASNISFPPTLVGAFLKRANTYIASIAQLAEHALRKRKVASSILAGGYMGRWSRGMILRSGRRGRGFDSRTAPCVACQCKDFIFYFF